MQLNYNKNSKHKSSLPNNRNFYRQVFIMKCDVKLSFFTKQTLVSCCNKKFYQVLETIEYSLKTNLQQQNYLLQIFYSIAIAMQNNTNTSFFDIRIENIIMKKTYILNKINSRLVETNYLKITVFCTAKSQKKKKETFW